MRFAGLSLFALAAIPLAPLALPARAQPALTTILTNGPTSNRINIVVLSEGYRSNQLAQFLVDATNAVNNLLAGPPYAAYRSYFNAFAISIASVDSGSDHPNSGVYKNTYFNSSYDSHGVSYLITIPPNDRDASYANGQGKVDALLQSLMPEYDLVVLVVNDYEYGGSGGATLIVSLHYLANEIVVHESGHTFAGLTDEYSSPFPGYTPTEKPNATTQTNRDLIKWRAWIEDSTPVPTPQTPGYNQVVGLFQGAQYQSAGWYRPKLDCKMRTLGIPFCEVCSETIVRSIYQPLRVIESLNPSSTNLSISTTQAVLFSVTTLQPLTHNLNVQWFTNGVAVSGATNNSFMLNPQFLSNGTHTLRAQVRDATPLVRNDPSGALSNSAAWNLSIAITELRLVSPLGLPDGRFTFCVTGAAPQGFVIQASTSFLNWVPLATNSLAGGTFNFTNSSGDNFSHRFYRAVAAP